MAKNKSISEQVADEQNELLAQAESILTEAWTEGRQLSFGETQFLETRLGWDRAKRNDEIRRVNRVGQFQLVAGSSTDRKKLASEHATATAERDEQCPALVSQIAELQKQFDALEKRPAALQSRLDQVDAALKSLTELAPPKAKHEAAALRQNVNETLGCDLRECEASISELSMITDAKNYKSQNEHCEAVRRYERDLRSSIDDGGPLVHNISENSHYKLAFTPQWAEHLPKAKAYLAEIQAQHGPLKAQYDAAISEANKPCKVYHR